MLSRKAAKIYFLVFPSWGSHRTDIKSVLKIGTNVQEEKQTYLSTKKTWSVKTGCVISVSKQLAKLKLTIFLPSVTERVQEEVLPLKGYGELSCRTDLNKQTL